MGKYYSEKYICVDEQAYSGGWTAFMYACIFGHKDVVQLFLDHSDIIELNAKDNRGWTALIFAMNACLKPKDVVKLFLHHSEKIDFNARDNDGQTVLMLACQRARKIIVKLILEHSERIELNAKDNNGNTALMIANQRGHQGIIQLVKAKLHPNTRILRKRKFRGHKQ